MTTFAINVPDNEIALIAEAFANQNGFDIPGGAKPEGFDEMTDDQQLNAKVEFARQTMINFINDTVRAYKRWQALQTHEADQTPPVNIS